MLFYKIEADNWKERDMDDISETNIRRVGAYQMKDVFKKRGLPQGNAVMHMVFTGNPGTAKTTTARLFARILRENVLLSVGELYKVGRADLVGQYVGWTAKTVRKLFAQAKGSVLFIDEAYSLLGERNGLFGDEAINTIVQEMENHREDMIVIFAGYPEEMERFLDQLTNAERSILIAENFAIPARSTEKLPVGFALA